MRLMDMDTGAQFCRVDYLMDGRIVFHIPSDMPLPKDIMVMNGKGGGKADVSLNIYAHIRANQLGEPVSLYCAIGDEYVDGLPYSAIVEVARDYIFNHCGGFEKFAEWGLI